MRRIVAIRCQAVVGVRGRLPPSGDRWLRRQVATGYAPNRSHPLPSGGGGARKASTVWRQVATEDRWRRGMRRIVAIRCQAVVGVRGRLPPSGDRWLRKTGGVGVCAES
jgi:hypothetical protein